jgi:predicted Zn-dependent protease
MHCRVWPICLSLALLGTGCFPGNDINRLVPSNPFGTGGTLPDSTKVSAATEEVSKRVGVVGRKILTLNPQLDMQPAFVTIGQPDEEIFHRSTETVFITEGLVLRCQTEGQLAAVLCHELGKMAAERAVLKIASVRSNDREPPMDLQIGTDSRSALGTADNTHAAEVGLFERDQRRTQGISGDVLAQGYLLKANYSANDWVEAAPILRAADSNVKLEKQITGRP